MNTVGGTALPERISCRSDPGGDIRWTYDAIYDGSLFRLVERNCDANLSFSVGSRKLILSISPCRLWTSSSKSNLTLRLPL